MTSTIEHEPFGVEIDIDLQARTPADDDAMRSLFREHHLLTFRGQNLTLDAQIDLMRLFGTPLLSAIDGVGYITNEQVAENVLGNSALAFHSDLSFSPKPFDAISLHAVQVENGRSSTLFIDATASYDRLPESIKREIDGYQTLQVFGGPNLAGRNGDDIDPALPRYVHPLVMTHPRTAEKLLFANYNQTARIMELGDVESEELIQRLFAHAYAPDAIYEHVWQNGDIVVWDNLAVQHARGAIADVGIRRLQRVVAAEAGFYEQHPQFLASAM